MSTEDNADKQEGTSYLPVHLWGIEACQGGGTKVNPATSPTDPKPVFYPGLLQFVVWKGCVYKVFVGWITV